MKKITKHITQLSLVLLVALSALVGCDKENDFYEVGRQPVFLNKPVNDTIWVLDYQKPDTMYLFSWQSKRQFIYFDLMLGLDPDFEGTKVEVPTGVRRDFYLSTMKIDSLLSSMNIGIGQTVQLYWTVNVVDPETGWCDEVNKLKITRCDLPTNVILLGEPGAETEVVLDKENPEGEVIFNWTCETDVTDYMLHVSFNEDFENAIMIACGSSQSHAFTNEYLDEFLKAQGLQLGESVPLFWKVTATGNLNNPIENSAVREISMKRFARDPVQVVLVAPEQGETVLLEADKAEELFEFKWECDTTGVTFKLKLYDTELGVVEEFDAGEKTFFSMQQQDLDLLLEQKFEMVASQKKKMYWEVIPSDPLRAVSETTGQFTVRRFEAQLAVQPITILNAPETGATYVLSYQTPETILSTVSWDCGARNVTYALEYSLNADMSLAKIKPLSTNKSVDFTHKLLDDILSDLGASYLTKTLYWRITSTVTVSTEPSEVRSLNLTGMLKLLVDLRDPANPETYNVVKVGDRFWMAENLRATRYSDGTAFTAVDLDSKQSLDGAVTDPKIIGRHYTWPTALREYEKATSSETTIIQGACPDGWHISTLAEWKEVINKAFTFSFHKDKEIYRMSV